MPSDRIDPPIDSPRLIVWDEHLLAIADIIRQWGDRKIPDDNAARAIAAILRDRESADG